MTLFDTGTISEFGPGEPTGRCGETMLEAMMAAHDGRKISHQNMTDLSNWMRDSGQVADRTSESTYMTNLSWAARQKGYPIATEWDYGQLGDWHQYLLDHAGVEPIGLELNNGQALVDAVSGWAHDEAGLHGHYIMVRDKCPQGYVCVDGDNPRCAQGYYVIYPYSVLAAAQPCALLAFSAPPTQQEANVGWTQQANGWMKQDSTGFEIGKGLYDFAVSLGLASQPLQMSERPYGGGYSVAAFPNDIIWWSPDGQPHHDRGGIILSQIFGQMDSQVKTLTDDINQLRAELANQPTPAPTQGTSVPPELHSFLSGLVNDTQAQADVNTQAKDFLTKLFA